MPPTKPASPAQAKSKVPPLALASLRVAVRVLGNLSRGRALMVTRCLMPIYDLLSGAERRRNMRIVLGPLGWDEPAIRAMDRAHVRYFSRWWVDFARLMHQPPAEITAATEIEGEAHVHEALKEGRGVMLVMSHLGTNLYAPLSLAYRGLPVEGVFNVRSEGGRHYINGLGQRFGSRVAFVRQGAGLSLLRSLRKGQVIALANDVCVEESRALWMPLGGGFTPIDIGPAALALGARCPTLMGDSWHLPDGRSHVQFRPATAPMLAATDPEELTACMLKEFEMKLLQRPEQWWLWAFAQVESGRRKGERLVPE